MVTRDIIIDEAVWFPFASMTASLGGMTQRCLGCVCYNGRAQDGGAVGLRGDINDRPSKINVLISFNALISILSIGSW
jgi:hypothetical protein